MKIMGSDLSHHNREDDIIVGLTFYMLKATEGKTMSDAKMDSHLKYIWSKRGNTEPIFGFYHFARPDNNSVSDEINNYLNKIKPHIGQCLTALDFEGPAETWMNKVGPSRAALWIKDWLDMVSIKTNSTPFLYASASLLSKMQQRSAFTEILKRYPLWVAHYGKSTKYSSLKVHGNIWQYTSDPLDLDIYYGDRESIIRKAITRG